MRAYVWDAVSASEAKPITTATIPDLPLNGKELAAAANAILSLHWQTDPGHGLKYRVERGVAVCEGSFGHDNIHFRLFIHPAYNERARVRAEAELAKFKG